jgi:hypothetical protein
MYHAEISPHALFLSSYLIAAIFVSATSELTRLRGVNSFCVRAKQVLRTCFALTQKDWRECRRHEHSERRKGSDSYEHQTLTYAWHRRSRV